MAETRCWFIGCDKTRARDSLMCRGHWTDLSISMRVLLIDFWEVWFEDTARTPPDYWMVALWFALCDVRLYGKPKTRQFVCEFARELLYFMKADPKCGMPPPWYTRCPNGEAVEKEHG